MEYILKQPYQISIWQDYYSADHASFEQQKIAIIGSNQMTSQNRAIDPVLVSNINGTHKFSFKLYYSYIDNQSGQKVDNLYCHYLTNESKVKLYYKNQWYDFIVKNIEENSEDCSYSYQLIDSFINQLSKNGFDLVFDTEKRNNMGTAIQLINRVIDGSGWQVNLNSDSIYQRQEEALFQASFKTTQQVRRYQKSADGRITLSQQLFEIQPNKPIYIFYSCLSKKQANLQFIYVDGTPDKDGERIILNQDSQYLLQNVNHGVSSYNAQYDIYIPTELNNNVEISSLYRGERYVMSQQSIVDPVLKRVVKKYKKQNTENIYWGYEQDEYIAPNLLQNFVSNNTNFTKTSGWRGGYVNSGSDFLGEVQISTYDQQGYTVAENLTNQSLLSEKTFTPYLHLTFSGSNSVVTNSGFYDSKRKVGQLKKGQRFVLYYRLRSGLKMSNNYSIQLVNTKYTASDKKYQIIGDPYIIFNNSIYHQRYGDSSYYYRVAQVVNGISNNDYMSADCHPMLMIKYSTSAQLEIADFQCFRYVEDPNSSDHRPLLPTETFSSELDNSGINNPILVKSYHYFPNYSVSQILTPEQINDQVYNMPQSQFIPIYRSGMPKVRSIEASQSNRFNIIQQICQTFECWATFDIQHDQSGHSGQKLITLHNFIGQDNPVDFIYGINIKSINRTIDSDQIVTKLIVQQNSNEYADGQMCTIAKASTNYTKQTAIYNFDYYIRQGMLQADHFEKDLYLDSTGYLGYYINLHKLNTKIEELYEMIRQFNVPIMQAQADVQLYTAALESSNSQFQNINQAIINKIGSDFYSLKNAQPNSQLYKRFSGTADSSARDEVLLKYFTEAAQYETNINEYSNKLGIAKETYDSYVSKVQRITQDRQYFIHQKEQLNSVFFKKYNRYIQEGTWIDESYVDNNLYYYDALAVSYTSSVPKVTYKIDVVDVSVIPGYELFSYRLGDRTHVQDPQFFGFVIDPQTNLKTPAREEVVINEISESLDNPDNNVITVQNYKNLFQDLFQRINATVQQVQFSTGAYERAAQLAQADVGYKLQFLQDALNDASTVLTNLAQQTVVWDSTGITITDGLNQGQKIRIVSGGILMTTDGGETWSVGITAKGISANKLTSGQVDTSLIQIMNGKQAYFRWDAFGITAYDFSANQGIYLNGLNTYKGVRFDRYGIYGYQGINGATWHPEGIVNWDSNGTSSTHITKSIGTGNDYSKDYIRNYSIFELTWDGLYLNLGSANYSHQGNGFISGSALGTSISHASKTIIGKVDDLIYNAWNQNNPYYDISSAAQSAPHFVKVMQVSNGNNNPQFIIFDDGTLWAQNARIKGQVVALSGKIGGWKILENQIVASNGTVGMNSAERSLEIDNPIRFYAGAANNEDKENAKFKVFDDGSIQLQYNNGTSSNPNYVWISANGTRLPGGSQSIALGIGGDTEISCPFYVTSGGRLVTNNAQIRQGYIGGFTIASNTLATQPSGAQVSNAIISSNTGVNNSFINVNNSTLMIKFDGSIVSSADAQFGAITSNSTINGFTLSSNGISKNGKSINFSNGTFSGFEVRAVFG